MLQKTLPALLAGLMLGSVAASNAALAQLGPPPGRPPMLAGPPPGFAGPPPGPGGPRPGIGAGGPAPGPIGNPPVRGPAGIPPRDLAGGPHRLDGDARGLDRGGQAGIRGVEARAADFGVSGHTRKSYTSDGHGYGRDYRYWPHGVTVGAYAYDSSYATSGNGCYDVSTYRRYDTRRVLICQGD